MGPPKWKKKGKTPMKNAGGKRKGLTKAFKEEDGAKLIAEINSIPSVRKAVQGSYRSAYRRNDKSELEFGTGSFEHAPDELEDEDLLVVTELLPKQTGDQGPTLRITLVNAKKNEPVEGDT